MHLTRSGDLSWTVFLFIFFLLLFCRIWSSASLHVTPAHVRHICHFATPTHRSIFAYRRVLGRFVTLSLFDQTHRLSPVNRPTRWLCLHSLPVGPPFRRYLSITHSIWAVPTRTKSITIGASLFVFCLVSGSEMQTLSAQSFARARYHNIHSVHLFFFSVPISVYLRWKIDVQFGNRSLFAHDCPKFNFSTHSSSLALESFVRSSPVFDKHFKQIVRQVRTPKFNYFSWFLLPLVLPLCVARQNVH